MKKAVLLAVVLALCLGTVPATAQTIVYIPFDNRPVSLDYVVETARAAGIEVVTPPPELLGDRTRPGNAKELWAWLGEHGRTADAVVASSDALLYGSLVASRTHTLPVSEIEDRLLRFARLKAANPGMRLYVFGTIMRTPRASAGGVEPPYYEEYGPSIFRITALRDKAETNGLTHAEENELRALTAAVPAEALTDWYERREKNFAANVRLVEMARNGTLSYLLLGRDDCSPLSQTHMESRHIAAAAAGLPASRYASFPGADQLEMLMLTRAVNDAAVRIPLVRAFYAPGAGPETVASYEDVAVGKTVTEHVVAAGGIMLGGTKPDLVLAVNTPEHGVTLEAGDPHNRGVASAATLAFVAEVARNVRDGAQVAVGDIAFANGADNALMAELAKRNLLFRLAAYSGWNTASNTLGYAISQGLLAPRMAPATKDRLLAARLLDDWAYQANVRWALNREVLEPAGGDWYRLDGLAPRLAAEANRRLRAFAAANFPAAPLNRLRVSFPWNRMFEVKIEL